MTTSAAGEPILGPKLAVRFARTGALRRRCIRFGQAFLLSTLTLCLKVPNRKELALQKKTIE